MELLQKALLETAFAYYRLGTVAQYDSEPMTYQNRHTYGPSRLSSGSAPEQAGNDLTLYTVCSDFCYNVYKNAFDYELMGCPKDCLTFNMTMLPADHPLVVLKGGREDGIQDKEEALKKIRACLQVGDILVEYARALNGGPKGGHAMLFIGDAFGDGHEYLMHSGGAKINMDSGVDNVEPKGTVRIDDCDEHCFTPGADSKHNCYLTWFDEFIVLRPFQDPAFSGKLTASAESRVKYPGLSVKRELDRHRYLGAKHGETVTVSVTVKNNSEEDYKTLTIRETAPVGAELRSAATQWTVDVPAGCEMTFTVKAAVTAVEGETVTFPAGSVDTIPTREMTLQVWENHAQKRTSTQFANGFCAAAWGTELGLPEHPAELITGLFDVVEVPDVKKTGGQMLAPKAYENLSAPMKRIWDMLLPEHVGGRAVYLGATPENTMACFDRVKVFAPEAYRPGDVFFCMESPSILKLGKLKRAVVYIYLGEGRVMTWDEDRGPVEVPFADSIGKALRMNVILGMRP